MPEARRGQKGCGAQFIDEESSSVAGALGTFSTPRCYAAAAAACASEVNPCLWLNCKASPKPPYLALNCSAVKRQLAPNGPLTGS